jgi:predicted nucleic acid-binding protein
MSRFVVDASVVAKWYVPEILSAEARRFLGAGHHLVAPDLLGPELSNVLWKKVRRGEISLDEGREALIAFEAAPVQIVQSAPLLLPAYEAGVLLGRSAYGSLYLVLAIQLGFPVVTADRRFYNAIRGSLYAGSIEWLEDVAGLM